MDGDPGLGDLPVRPPDPGASAEGRRNAEYAQQQPKQVMDGDPGLGDLLVRPTDPGASAEAR